MRINDSLLIRIIGLNILECIPIFYVWFQFHGNDRNKDDNKSNQEEENYESDEENHDLTEEVYIANRKKNN